MECFRCSTPIPKDSRYCAQCGAATSGSPDTSGAGPKRSDDDILLRLREATASEYEIERELGRGGMAVVYLATEKLLDRQVAIKVLPPELTFGNGAERFLREAKTAAALGHPNIIPIYRVASSGSLFWYAMKYVEGKALDEVLETRGQIPIEETIDILRQVADALDYAHQRNVIHRDVKPANVMLEARHLIVVTDFGIAKALGEGTLTASGSVIGTPYYMSPEQCTGKPVTGKADQYSVAVMAYQMLSGGLPFDGETAIGILHQHVGQAAPSLAERCPDLPDHVPRTVHRALAKNPDDRFRTVSSFIKALQYPSDAETVIVDTRPRRSRITEPHRRRTAVLAAAAAIALVGATGLWWVPQVTNRQNRPSTTPGVATPTSATPTLEPQSGVLSLRGVPTGATTLIDGNEISDTLIALAPGAHGILIRADGFEPLTDTIRIRDGDSVPFTFAEFATRIPAPVDLTPLAPEGDREPPPPATPQSPPQTGVLVVQISGGWASIELNGTLWGQDTRLRDTLPAGVHTLHLERPGFETVDTTITLRAGETITVPVTLRRRQ